MKEMNLTKIIIVNSTRFLIVFQRVISERLSHIRGITDAYVNIQQVQ
jgi:hypothetical protein